MRPGRSTGRGSLSQSRSPLPGFLPDLESSSHDDLESFNGVSMVVSVKSSGSSKLWERLDSNESSHSGGDDTMMARLVPKLPTGSNSLRPCVRQGRWHGARDRRGDPDNACGHQVKVRGPKMILKVEYCKWLGTPGAAANFGAVIVNNRDEEGFIILCRNITI